MTLIKPTYTDSEGNERPDYWAVAQKYCEIEGGHITTTMVAATTLLDVLFALSSSSQKS